MELKILLWVHIVGESPRSSPAPSRPTANRPFAPSSSRTYHVRTAIRKDARNIYATRIYNARPRQARALGIRTRYVRANVRRTFVRPSVRATRTRRYDVTAGVNATNGKKKMTTLFNRIYRR